MQPELTADRPTLLQADAGMRRRARHLTTTFLLEVGDVAYLVDIVEGSVHTVRRGPFVMASWQFALRAPADEWAAFWSSQPAPGHHDLMALRKRRVLTMEGDLRPLMANLRYFKELLASVREHHGA